MIEGGHYKKSDYISDAPFRNYTKQLANTSVEVMKEKAKHLPGIQGPNHESLFSNNNLKEELSSHPEASLMN